MQARPRFFPLVTSFMTAFAGGFGSGQAHSVIDTDANKRNSKFFNTAPVVVACIAIGLNLMMNRADARNADHVLSSVLGFCLGYVAGHTSQTQIMALSNHRP